MTTLATLRALLDRAPTLHIVFDGPPSHESGRFVEVENDAGASVSVGEWTERPDGFWDLTIPDARTLAAALAQAVEALEAQPPPANAALLAAATRGLVESLKRARDEETTRAHAAELHRNDVVERLRLMEERAEKAERERDEAQAMLDAMTLLSCIDFDGTQLRVSHARISIAELANPALDVAAREEITQLCIEECRDLCTDIDRLLAHIVALQRQLASAEAWRDIEATRRADALDSVPRGEP